jgi:hydrogenase maturation protein HypF
MTVDTHPTRRTCIEAWLHGNVQGAGVRPRIARLAGQCQVSGWVRNAPSGVELQAEGEAANVERFLELLRSMLPDTHLQTRPCGRAACELPPGFRIERSSTAGPTGSAIPLDRVVCHDCLEECRTPGNRRFGYALNSCARCGPRYSLLTAMPFDRQRTSLQPFTMCAACQTEYDAVDHRRCHAQTNGCPHCGPDIWFAASQVSARSVAQPEAGTAVLSRPKPEAADHRPPFRSAVEEYAEASRAAMPRGYPALLVAAQHLLAGELLAVKGIGGYQLVCDATNAQAVESLRARKGRAAKPLAVMVRSLQAARELADVDEQAAAALQSPAGPIVLLRAIRPSIIADAVHPRMSDIGIMLPTSALHALLVEAVGRPLVVTSGNREGEPIEYNNAAATRQLGPLVAGFVHHNREIVRPIDDSVVRCMAGRTVVLRAARGLAPCTLPALAFPLLNSVPLHLAASSAESQPVSSPAAGSEDDLPATVLATGGDQKAAIALARGTLALLGPHIGDLTGLATRQRYLEQSRQLQQLLDCRPTIVAHDLHPDYVSTRWAQHTQLMQQAQPPPLAQQERAVSVCEPVQHHHAHIVAGMYEHGWLDRQVLGFSFDGTGAGPDGTLWGGEVLLASVAGYQRVGTFRSVPLVGGELAIRQPWRIAVAMLHDAWPALAPGQASNPAAPASPLAPMSEQAVLRTIAELLGVDEALVAAVLRVSRAGTLAPRSSSLGRLFDAVAAIVLAPTSPAVPHAKRHVRRQSNTFPAGLESHFEGDVALQLESLAHPPGAGTASAQMDRPVARGPGAANAREELRADAETGAYRLEISSAAPFEIDWRPLIRELVRDRLSGVARPILSSRFHAAIANTLQEIAGRYPDLPVVCMGGVFQNRMLVESLQRRLAHRPAALGLPGMIPPGDGGLAVGQLAIAAYRHRSPVPCA